MKFSFLPRNSTIKTLTSLKFGDDVPYLRFIDQNPSQIRRSKTQISLKFVNQNPIPHPISLIEFSVMISQKSKVQLEFSGFNLNWDLVWLDPLTIRQPLQPQPSTSLPTLTIHRSTVQPCRPLSFSTLQFSHVPLRDSATDFSSHPEFGGN